MKNCVCKSIIKSSYKDIFIGLITIILLILADLFLPISIKNQWFDNRVFEIAGLTLLIGITCGIGLRLYELRER